VSTEVQERQHREVEPREAIPVKLSHVVVNSPKKEELHLYRESLAKLSTGSPSPFLRCNADHHSLAVAGSENALLNHVAFEVRGVDEMMRGGGRVVKDGRAQMMWGPDATCTATTLSITSSTPQSNVSEYTAEVEQILDDAAWTPVSSLRRTNGTRPTPGLAQRRPAA
jgi:hypothetical protein